jgi:hypothetical protein
LVMSQPQHYTCHSIQRVIRWIETHDYRTRLSRPCFFALG